MGLWFVCDDEMIVVKRTIMENALEALCTFPYLYEIRNFPEQFIYSIIAMNTPWIFKGSMFPYIWNYSLKQRADSTEDVITARRAMLNLLNG